MVVSTKREWVGDATGAGVAANDESSPVLVAVEHKTCSAGPLMPHSPKHVGAIQFIEGITCIDEKKAPMFLLMVHIPYMLHGMNCTFNTCLETRTELINTTGLRGFRASNLEECFGKGTTPSFSNPNGSYARTFVKRNKANEAIDRVGILAGRGFAARARRKTVNRAFDGDEVLVLAGGQFVHVLVGANEVVRAHRRKQHRNGDRLHGADRRIVGRAVVNVVESRAWRGPRWRSGTSAACRSSCRCRTADCRARVLDWRRRRS